MLKRRTLLLLGAAAVIAQPAEGAFISFGTFVPPAVTVLTISPNSGITSGGTPVTITGGGFIVSGTTVMIGGVSATSVVVSSSTMLTCVTGAASPGGYTGPASVVATTSFGSNPANTLFTYTGGAGQVASVPLSSFTSVNGQGSASANADGTTTGWKTGTGAANTGIWCILAYWFNFPTSDYYTFTVPAYALGASSAPGNSLMIYVDQLQLQTSIGNTTNNNWFSQFVSNLSTVQNYSTVNIPVTAGYHLIHVTFCSNAYESVGGTPLNTGVHGDRLNITDTGIPIPIEPAGSRDPGKFPLSSYHFLNTPLSTTAAGGAVWSSGSTPADTTINSTLNYGFNRTSFSSNWWFGASASPIVNFAPSNNNTGPPPPPASPVNNFPVRIPAGAFSSAGSDLGVCFVDTTNPRYRYAIDGGQTNGANTFSSYRLVAMDSFNLNPALPQSCTFFGCGTITQADIDSGVIAHRLGIGAGFSATFAPAGQTSQFSGMPFPACESDAGWVGEYTNTNGVPYGSVIGIPAGVPLPAALVGNAGATMMWNCLQNYGGFFNQSSGTFPACNFDLEGSVNGPVAAQITGSMATIKPFLRILTNPQPFTPGNGFGGANGTPIVPLLPGITGGLGKASPWPSLGLPPYSIGSNPAIVPILGAAPSGTTLASGSPQGGEYGIVIPAGSFVIVAFAAQGSGAMTYSSLLDSTGAANVYHIVPQVTASASVAQVCLAYCLNTVNPIPANATWKMTTTGTSIFFEFMGALYVPDVSTPTLHASATTTGNAQALSVACAASNGDLVIGVTFVYAQGTGYGYGTLTDTGGFLPISSSGYWAWDYLAPTSGASQTYSKTWNGATAQFQGIIASFSGLP